MARPPDPILARLRLVLCPKVTIDRDYSWLVYRYLIPDAFAWLLGFTVIRVWCAVCGARRLLWLPLWWRAPALGEAKRAALVQEHQHPRMSPHPQYWEAPPPSTRNGQPEGR